MAKRKRLTPTPLMADEADLSHASSAELETKSFFRPKLGAPAPIAHVAADVAAHAALAEVTDAMARARAEGRLVLRLPLAQIDTDHLMRDRIGLDEEELQPLMASLRDHGQRSPIEVTELAEGRFGLISGWRRMQALGRLWAETQDPRFAEVQALLRRPDSAQDAYVAMVEENEIRLGLSYYERARIAARAVDGGVFDSEKQALQRLFSSASRARRSKIGSFLTLYHHLDGVLRFPAAIPERLGLAVAKALEDRPQDIAPLQTSLRADPAPDAAAEQARLAEFAAGKAERAGQGQAKPKSTAGSASEPMPVPDPAARKELRPGVFLDVAGGWLKPILTLSGPSVDPQFREDLENWLAQRG